MFKLPNLIKTKRKKQARHTQAPQIQHTTPHVMSDTQTVLTLRDLIAPAFVEVDFKDLIINKKYNRMFYITAYPRTVAPNFLDALINMDNEGAVSIFIYPSDIDEVIKKLRQKIAEIEASLLIQMESGKVLDPKEKVKLEDARKLIDQIAAGTERFFSVGIYIRVQADNKKEIEHLTNIVQSIVTSSGMKLNTALLNVENAFHSTLPKMQDRLLKHRELDTTTIAYTFPFTSYHLTHPDGILYGINLHSRTLVIFNRFRMPNANEVVFATSGAGKSYYVKLQILRYMLVGTRCFVIDPEAEYKRMTEVVNGTYINFSPTTEAKINPFDFFEDPTKSKNKNLLQDKILSLHTFLSLLFRTKLSSIQNALLDKALFLAYKEKGITNDPATWTRTPPLLEDLYKILKGMPEPQAQDMAERLLPYVVGSSAGIFNKPTNIDINNQLVVIAVRDLREELRPIAMYLILDYLWSQIKSDPQQKLLMIDEAWHLMQFPQSAKFIFGIAKRARKYNLGLTTISQDVDEFINSKYGKAVITNASMKMLLKQDSSAIKLLKELFNLTVGEQEFLINAPVGEGLFFAGKYHMAIKVISNQLEHKLITSKPGETVKIKKDVLTNLTPEKLVNYSQPYSG